MHASNGKVTIVGSGLAGSLLACYLGRAGIHVDLYERRPEPQPVPGSLRTTNLTLSTRALHALREVDLAETVLASALPLRGRMVHEANGRQSFQSYGSQPRHHIYSVSRGHLNAVLTQALEQLPSVRVFHGYRCTGLDLASNMLNLEDARGHALQVACETVVGADGVYSAVRHALQRSERFSYRQEYLPHGYRELTIPVGPTGTSALERHVLHVWPRGDFLLTALPNLDGSFTGTFFCPFEGPNSFADLQGRVQVEEFFRRHFADVVALVPELVDQFLERRPSSLITIRCSPWHHHGRVVLLGDACHAVMPSLGQGTNAAFEDCIALHDCLRQYPDREQAFRSYERLRKEHVDALEELAAHSFAEMTQHVTSPGFRWWRWSEMALHRLLRDWYQPLPVLISATRVPYAEALRRVQRRQRLLRQGGYFLLGLLLALGCGLLLR